MKKLLIFMVLAVLLLLIGCQSKVVEEKNFPDLFLELTALDISHGANFKEEQIGGMMANKDKIPGLIAELYALRQEVYDSNYKDRIDMFNFIQARIQMLYSELKYQRFLDVDTSNASCGNVLPIQKSTKLLKESINHGTDAMNILDELIQYSPFKSIIGIDSSRTKFYNFDFSDLSDIIKNQKSFVVDKCKLNPI